MEHEHARALHLVEPADRAAALHRIRVALVDQRQRDRGARCARDRTRLERAALGAREQEPERAAEERQRRLRLGIAEARVELDDLWASGREHEASIQRPAIGRAAAVHRLQHRRQDARRDGVLQLRGHRGRRRVRAHAARVGPAVAVERALVVARRGQEHVSLAVTDRHDRGLFPADVRLQHNAATAVTEPIPLQALAQERLCLCG
jgi:hypothetical protein